MPGHSPCATRLPRPLRGLAMTPEADSCAAPHERQRLDFVGSHDVASSAARVQWVRCNGMQQGTALPTRSRRAGDAERPRSRATVRRLDSWTAFVPSP